MAPFVPPAKNQGNGKLTEQQLKISEWFLSHKLLLKKILLGVVIAIGAPLWLYSLYGVIDWAFISGPKERANLDTILQIKTSSEAMQAAAATAIAFGEAEVSAGGLGKYDMLVTAENMNPDWWVEFKYRFVGEGYEGNYKKGFILPSEKKYITDLGVEKAIRPSNVRFEYTDLKYHRINPHEIPDYAEWAAEHFNFKISGKKFTTSVIKGAKNISALSFTAQNDSAYGFWSAGFYGLLYRGGQLASINYISAENFKAGESRDLQMPFYEGLPVITKYEVVPEVNIFDPDAYIEQK